MPTLDWLNRADAFTTAPRVPYRLLDSASTHGGAASADGNLLIQGDNFEALKALLPFYRGQVKCIFIDPPYNTKSAFEHYDDNMEHSQWLSMMLPRLQLLRELLRDDGSIWVTIDDNEGHYLKVLMDEVFGRGNFVANAVWQKKYTVANDAKWLSDSHDHVLVFARNKEAWRPLRLPRTEEMNERYRNPDDHPRGVWKATPLYAKRTGSEKEQAFVFRFKNGFEWSPPRGSSPRFPAESLRAMDANDEIWFGVDGKAGPSRKTFLADLLGEGPPSSTIWLHSETGHNHEAREEVKPANPEVPFGTPKPERLIKRVLELATAPNDLVLDSVLGSGTTAAVARKMGRRWIGIEMGEHAATHCLPRLQKVIDGEQGGISKAVNWQGGGGFRFMTLGAPVFDAQGCIHPDVRFATLAAFVWQQETGTVLGATNLAGTPYLGTHAKTDGAVRALEGRDGLPLPLPDEPSADEAPVGRMSTAYYLLFNGILGDKRPASGNVLTLAVLDALLALHADTPEPGAPLVVYGEACRIGEARLGQSRVSFKHIPYDVRAR
jgi:adenine-specific DNA-methyltransferase